jgi:beta-lactamase superfamily II metal-dependent hydrolase
MVDFYQIDFLPVHREKSGDAIAIRYQIGERWWVHLVDGGYASTAPDVSNHIRQQFGTNLINNVVVTHPDQDHAEGLADILESFVIESLWMFRPWQYSQTLLPYLARYNSTEKLAQRLREEYAYIAKLEEIASRKGIPIHEPIQGAWIGAFRVLAPSLPRYLRLVIDSDKTPQPAAGIGGILGNVLSTVAPIIKYVTRGWGSEKFSPDETSSENEMSVVQYAFLNGHRVLLTGDAGRGGMTEAAYYAPQVGLQLPGIYRFQVPHHGGRRNISTAILDRWLGPPLVNRVQRGAERFTAMISAAKEDPKHPRKAVMRAMHHRGAFVATTENGWFSVSSSTAPARGLVTITNLDYPNEQEEE